MGEQPRIFATERLLAVKRGAQVPQPRVRPLRAPCRGGPRRRSRRLGLQAAVRPVGADGVPGLPTSARSASTPLTFVLPSVGYEAAERAVEPRHADGLTQDWEEQL